MSTPQDLDDRFRQAVGALPVPGRRRRPGDPVADGSTLTGTLALELFDAQLTSRHLDLAARWLRSFGEGYDTVASAGHEGNAAVAAALRPGDPALLHPRSAAFYCVRAALAGATGGQAVSTDDDGEPADPLTGAARDVLRAVVASAADPTTGGRRKVFGSATLEIVPTMSSGAGHLPRAVGIGFALDRLRRIADGDGVPAGREAVALAVGSPAGSGPAVPAGSGPAVPAAGGGPVPAAQRGPYAGAPGLRPADLVPAQRRPGAAQPPARWPADAVVIASFTGTAVDHAGATAALNTAGWCDYTGIRLPVLFVCEDDAGAASDGWVAGALRSRPGLRYTAADGGDLLRAYDAAAEAVAWVREHRRPAVLHLATTRLLDTGAGGPGDDPLVGTARLLVAAGIAGPDELLARYDEIGWRVRQVAEEVVAEAKLPGLAEVAATLAPRRPLRVARGIADAAARAGGPGGGARAEAFGGRLPEQAGPLTLAEALNAALTDAMLHHPGMLVFGGDVTRPGAGHGVTRGLRDRFGPARVFDTVPDETSMLGFGLGAGLTGLLPVPQIADLARLTGAQEQLRTEAAAVQFLSAGRWRNPMVLRVAGLADPAENTGSGPADRSVSVLRDIPGLVLAVPSRPDDAAAMLRSCVTSAAVDGSVCVLLEPVGLYHTRDLYAQGDGHWLAPYAAPAHWATGHVPIGRARAYGVGSAEDLTIITFGNGVRMSLRAAARLAAEGYGCRVVDLRWLAPLPVGDIVREAAATGRVLVADETRRSGGVGEGVIAALVDGGYVGSARRIAAADSFIPLGPAARHVLIGEDAITEGARALLAG